MVAKKNLIPSFIRAPGDELPHLHIEASKGLIPLKVKELWEYRELAYFLIWRDIKVRYKQTALGVMWAIIQPVMTMVVFSIFFGKLGKLPSDGIPYPIFTFTALVPWALFSNGLTQASGSLVASSNSRMHQGDESHDFVMRHRTTRQRLAAASSACSQFCPSHISQPHQRSGCPSPNHQIVEFFCIFEPTLRRD